VIVSLSAPPVDLVLTVIPMFEDPPIVLDAANDCAILLEILAVVPLVATN